MPEVTSVVHIKYDFKDRMRILFGKEARIIVHVEVDRTPKVIKSESEAYVDHIIPWRRPVIYAGSDENEKPGDKKAEGESL